MKKKFMLALLLAGCCLLAGCSKTASDEDVFGPQDSVGKDPMAQQTQAAEPPSQAPVQSQAPAESQVPSEAPAPDESAEPYIDEVSMGEGVDLAEELVPMSAAPAALPTVLSPVASGTSVQSGGGAEIDYSNTKDGYVMARYAAANSKRLRVQVTGPSTTYTYDLPTGAWVTFPLSDGNGSYKVTVLQNTTGKKYAILAAANFQVALADEFAPFIRPNQYV
ncbi:MAG: hypothetical protein HFF28_05395, partial [Oscillospiraceae bacterium]|nr:hypothetical protein [Oscillospiraceae bacterium]